MHYDPRQDKQRLPYDPFKSCTAPTPIGWLSTVSKDGQHNLAPYSQWQNITFDPPIVMFAAQQRHDGNRKTTVLNAEQTGFFVWNMATFDLRHAVNNSAQNFADGVDVFSEVGVTKAACIDAPGARVLESPCHFECKYVSTLRLPGNIPAATTDVVFGEVVRIHINEDYLLASGRLDIAKIKPLARIGYYDYAAITDTFEMLLPNAGGA